MAKNSHGASKPSKPENEYFVREDAESKRRLAFQTKRQIAAKELERLKELHWNHCPKCGLEMHPMELAGVEVDVCFPCGGVFLDKGDIEHLRRAHARRPGVTDAILNWFSEETKHPIKD
jgi:Zn-finger nucleic acid-binding protein